MFRFIHEKKDIYCFAALHTCILYCMHVYEPAYYFCMTCAYDLRKSMCIIVYNYICSYFIFPLDVNKLFPLTIMHNNSMYFSAFLRRRVGACYPQGKHPQDLMAAPFVHVSHPEKLLVCINKSKPGTFEQHFLYRMMFHRNQGIILLASVSHDLNMRFTLRKKDMLTQTSRSKVTLAMLPANFQVL